MNNLEEILEDLSKRKRDKALIISQAIEKRLNQSLRSYYDSLSKTANSLSMEDGKKLLKHMET